MKHRRQYEIIFATAIKQVTPNATIGVSRETIIGLSDKDLLFHLNTLLKENNCIPIYAHEQTELLSRN